MKTKQKNNLTLSFFTNVAYVNLFQLLLAVASVRANAVKKSKSDAHAFTIGQIYQGLPVNTAYVASHPRNIRVITGVDHGHGHIAGYGAISNIGNAGFGHHGYDSYGKRNAYSGQFSGIWGIENSGRAQHILVMLKMEFVGIMRNGMLMLLIWKHWMTFTQFLPC